MTQHARSREPELLDELAPEDPRAQRSRRDLRRVHRAMGSVATFRRLILKMPAGRPVRRILELGAGDGTLLLRLARALAGPPSPVELTLIDRHDLLSAQTRAGFLALNWHVRLMRMDVLEWAAASLQERYDLCTTALFLHHFSDAELAAILSAVARRADAFIACEPRRDRLSRLGAMSIGLLGAGDVTRGDAAKSVAAGFRGRELTALWPDAGGDWIIDETPRFPFTHSFTAVRAAAPPAGGS